MKARKKKNRESPEKRAKFKSPKTRKLLVDVEEENQKKSRRGRDRGRHRK